MVASKRANTRERFKNPSHKSKKLLEEEERKKLQEELELRSDLEKNPQLSRRKLLDRCILEDRIYRNSFKYVGFLILVGLYCATVVTYDPTSTINDLHRNLRSRYKADDTEVGPLSVSKPMDVMVYTELFIEATYEMASALIDANTFHQTDAQRCFNKHVHDVCRLQYWRLPLNANHANYYNRTRVTKDQLSWANSESIMDCAAANPKQNCIDRADPARNASDASGSQKSFGLTPEDPIIFSSRMEYPLRSVVPLAPIAWQTRSKRVDCAGFGNLYNNKILGAGECTVDKACDVTHNTEFINTQRSIGSSREQSIFLTYKEPVFACNDRSQEDDVFLDKSWHPWITYDVARHGKPLLQGELNGVHVFFKFITDVAYLQAPFPQFLNVVDYDNLTDAECQVLGATGATCSPWTTTSDTKSSASTCVDPLDDPSHPMWSEEQERDFLPCSYHHLWSKDFLATDIRSRKNTFFTFETKEYTIATLIITPFGKGQPDIMTLATATFSVDQAGFISPSFDLLSTSETPTSWYYVASCALLFSLWLFVSGLYEYFFEARELYTLVDICIGFGTGAYIIIVMIVDNLPPHPQEELLNALNLNTQEGYFRVMNDVISFSHTHTRLRTVAFFFVMGLLFRFQILLGDHPRLSTLTRVLANGSDDMLHFFFLLIVFFVLLGLLAWWAFGGDSDSYHTQYWSFYKLFRMFVGDADALFEPSGSLYPLPLKQMLFVVLFVFLIFFILVNFFLAIIVNNYTKLAEEMRDVHSVVDHFFADMVDIFARTRYRYWRGGWPTPRQILNYLESIGHGKFERSAVTAEELHQFFVHKNGRPVFSSLAGARFFVTVYRQKVHGVIKECNHKHMFVAGSFWSPTDGIKVGNPSKQDLLAACAVVKEHTELIRADLDILQKKKAVADDANWNHNLSVGLIPHPSGDRFISKEANGSPRSPRESDLRDLQEWELDPDRLRQALHKARQENKQMHLESLQAREEARTMDIVAESVTEKALCDAIVRSESQRLQVETNSAQHELFDIRVKMLKQETSSISVNGQQSQPQPVGAKVDKQAAEAQLRRQLLGADLKTHENLKLRDVRTKETQFLSIESDKLQRQIEDINETRQQLQTELASSAEVVAKLEVQLAEVEKLHKKPVPQSGGRSKLGFRMCT